MKQRIFHLVPQAAWSPVDGRWTPAGFAQEGFVHLSFPGQIAGTLELHFPPDAQLWLLEVEREAQSDLRLEESRGGQLFPHAYHPIELDTVLRHWSLEGRGGQWDLPEFGESADRDAPPGQEGHP